MKGEPQSYLFFFDERFVLFVSSLVVKLHEKCRRDLFTPRENCAENCRLVLLAIKNLRILCVRKRRVNEERWFLFLNFFDLV